ncbi:MAG: PKD domain-containing protein [Chitinophagales bacterium]
MMKKYPLMRAALLLIAGTLMHLLPLNGFSQVTCSIALQQTNNCAPKPILATATASTPNPYTITQYCWRLKNCATGTILFQSCGPNNTFSYVDTIPGIVCLNLTVFNSHGDSCNSAINNILISDYPHINMTFSPLEFCCPQVVTTGTPCQITTSNGTIDSLVIQPGCGPIQYFGNCPNSAIQLPHNCICPPGYYDITVVAKNSVGCYADTTYNDIIHIIAPPVASFTETNAKAHCASGPLTVDFTATNAGPNMTYQWIVDGVVKQTAQAPTGLLYSQTFPISPDCHNVWLVVRHPSGCADTLKKNDLVCVTAQPQVGFSQNITTACVSALSPATLTLTDTTPGGPHTITWNMSGGTPNTNFPTSNSPNPSFTIVNPGTYTVTVTASFGPGCNSTISQQVLVANIKPVADFSMNDTVGCRAPFPITYTATPCTGCTYSWSFANGTPNPQSGQVVTATYNTFTNSPVSTLLTVQIPGSGCSASVSKTLAHLKRLRPVIGLNHIRGCAPLSVQLTNLTPSFPGEIIDSVCWSFPGSLITPTCSSAPVNKVFSAPGCYSVNLYVTTLSGCRDSLKLVDTICTSFPPVCSVTADPDTMCFEADSVHFTLTCDSVNLVYANFGDFTQAYYHSTQFDHMYASYGNFTATIITYRDSCVGDTFKLPILVHPPAAKFKDSSTCGFGDTVYLVNQSKGANRWMWHFCNGDSSTAATPAILVPHCDSCKVDIVAYNDTFNCVHKFEKTFSTPCDSASVSPSQASVCVPKNGNVLLTLTNTSPNSILNLTAWDLNPGPGISYSSATGGSRTYTINSPGILDLAMRNISASQCTTVVHASVSACRIIADFGPLNACMPAPIQFFDASKDSICGITQWRWSFGDGGTDTVGNPLHAYAAPGTYQCKLVVTNSLGCKDSITKTVTMGNLVNFNYKLDTIVCPGNTTCVSNITTGVSLTWQWNLVAPGGGTSTYNTAAPCFTLPIAGDYKVYMRMQSGASCTKYDTFTIHVAFPIAAGMVSTDTLTCPNPPQVITFTNLSQYWDSTVTWDFGDGNFSPVSNTTHIYTQPGIYPVIITPTTNDGCSATAIVDTIVIFGPDGYFDYNPKPGICACKDSVDYTITTVNATDLTLIWGCSSGFTNVNNMIPGSVANPTVVNLSIPYCKTDTCQPQLIFEDATGCLVYRDLPYVWIDSPVVKFTFDSYGVCEQGNVCFQDITSYTLPPDHSWTVQRFWDFGDPASGALNFDTSANPCHYYDTTGGYNVKLYIRSNLGCFDSIITNLVVISEYPEAGFYGDDTLVCAYSPACFHDTSWIYPLTAADFRIWNWGDGTSDTVHSPDACHIYTQGGFYRVSMTVWDSAGCPDADSSIYIRVVDNPIANAGGDQTICYGAITQLTGTGTSNCFWTGPVSNPNTCNPTVQLFQDDSVTLIVTDQYQCADTSTIHLTVARVTADFTVGSTFCSDDSICVTDASTNVNGTLIDWTWDFSNNGPLLHGVHVCNNYHGFPQGIYNIELLATDDHGCVDSITKQVSILPSPNAAFSLNDTVVCSNQQICITDLTTSQTAISSWQWYYGDFPNNPVNGNNPPCHTYGAPYLVNYTIQLVVTDQNNCRDTSAIVVTVNEVPTANFNWSVSCESTPMQLTSSSTPGDGALNYCEWMFWQGSLNPVYDNNCNTSFQFPAGQYPVQFVVGDINGCNDTIVKTVTVDSISQLVIYPGDTTICAGTSVDYNVSGVFDQIVWTPNVWISDQNGSTVTVNPLANIGYIISAVNGVCAAASDTFSIRVLQPIPIEVNATPDQIVLGLTSNLTSQIPGQIDSIIWTPAGTLDCYDCPNPIATPIATTTYTATIYYSENGTTCTNSAPITITVLNNCDDKIVYVPNTFTPNGDGLNDIFMIRGLAATKINYFRIFDRWGHMVFEAQTGAPNEPKWGWDGTDLGGQKLNNGVFVYTYEIECINGETVHGQGNVTLVR